MKTIKERAIEKYCTHCGARAEYNCSAMDTPCNSIKNYIMIANEQKAIDDEFHRSEILRIDADLTDAMVAFNNEWSERLVALRAMLIDKACDWISENYEDIQCSQGRIDDIKRHLADFRKAMEE